MARPGLLGCLLKFPNNANVAHVPEPVMVFNMVGAETFVGSRYNIR